MTTPADTPPVYIDYLNRFDIEKLGFTDDDVLRAVEDALRMQGLGETEIEPRTHIRPRAGVEGHFNVLRGWIGGEIDSAGTKVVGDFVDNYRDGRPSEYGLLTLFDPRMGAPKALIDATGITEMRTGAMTALGAKYLGPEKPKVLGHIGARGTAYWNVRLLCHFFDFEEVRIHSRRPESRESFAETLRRDLGREIIVTEDWQSCLEGADIMVEASRLTEPTPLFKTNWIKPGSLVVPYGTMSTVELNLTDIMDKVVMDDWGQAHGVFGALRDHVDQGKLTAETLHAELGQIVAGVKPGRESADETILFWHRGLSLSDIALGHAMLTRAKERGLGQRLRFY
ncbi:ornithine cyclodeaminase family protein [Roseovarius rhodophyticola]|uniref:Ornithine cyclodeaminase family protein n=1 Tax=Roseovarius rhodophyticola TaxID=3080827 RepID=A0ABZ2TE33_9RHOB|nr:ornithine cyclodeaminase family protein [Roseovarius sp. W115]MDV2928196.1 ornithine cyclodeaminase family protein [Roseovarius sp. W115]